MADATTPVPSTPPPSPVRPVDAGTDRAPARDASAHRVVTGEVTRVLQGSGSGPYRLEVAIPPPGAGVSPKLIALLSPEAYPPGTTLRLRVLGAGSEVPYRIVDAIAGSSASLPSDLVRGTLSDRLVHAFREAGVEQVGQRLRSAEAAVRSTDGPLPLRISVASELAARGLPVTADTVRSGISLRSGALEQPVEVGARALIDTLRQYADRTPQRTTLLRSIGGYVAEVRAGTSPSHAAGVPVQSVTTSAPSAGIARAVEVVDTAFRLLTRGDAEFVAISRVLSALREGAPGSVLRSGPAPTAADPTFERTVDQLLHRHLPRKTEDTAALTSLSLRDLSPAGRANAIEVFTRLERELLERQPWLPEFRAASRELLGRAEALQYQHWIEVGSLDPETFFAGHGTWVDPDGGLPFRLAVRDTRDEDESGLGFRLVVESRRIGRVEIDGRLFEAEDPSGGAADASWIEERALTLHWRADDEETAKIMAADSELWASALSKAGFRADIRPQPRRSLAEVTAPVRGLDLQV